MSQEKTVRVTDGWSMLAFNLLALVVGLGIFVVAAVAGPVLSVPAALVLLGAGISFAGLFTLQPNEACLLNLFGSYVGTVRDSGFWWTNPFNSKRKVSLRSRNLESGKLKVNDKLGNPIEIAAVVVWHVA